MWKITRESEENRHSLNGTQSQNVVQWEAQPEINCYRLEFHLRKNFLAQKMHSPQPVCYDHVIGEIWLVCQTDYFVYDLTEPRFRYCDIVWGQCNETLKISYRHWRIELPEWLATGDLTMYSGRSRQNVDRFLSQRNLTKNDIFVNFYSNLEFLTGFQKPCDSVWIHHWCIRSIIKNPWISCDGLVSDNSFHLTLGYNTICIEAINSLIPDQLN